MSSLKERIIDHTTKMFARNGIKSVRMDDIAAEMGISKRTIYELFGDKENLILECIKYFSESIKARNCEITANANNVIEEFLMMFEAWDKQMDATYNIMSDAKKFYPKIFEKFHAQHTKESMVAIHGKLKKGMEEGLLMKNINLNLSISVVAYSLYGIMKKESMLPQNISERDAFRYVISYFLRGIATPAGIEMIDNYFEKKHSK